MNSKIIVYLAGKMSGVPEYNFPMFFKMEDELKKRGYAVVNPARIVQQKLGDKLKDPIWMATQFDYHAQLEEDIAVLKKCDTIALIQGWEFSNGAKKELKVALENGLGVICL